MNPSVSTCRDLEIHAVDVVAARAVDDPADLRPDRGHGTHAARLKCGVEDRTAEFQVTEHRPSPPERHHFRMSGRVAEILGMISLRGELAPIENDDRTDRR